MCTQQRKFYTNARCVHKTQPQRIFQYFKCGWCDECIRQKLSEWRVRSYYEAIQTFESGCKDSFILFDTLTYSGDYIKYFHDHLKGAQYTCWDHVCFSRDDVKKFMKRLRVNLERCGYEVKNNLRYLITCEYGEKKGRSHYHVLFFSRIPELKPLVLSRFISVAWNLGITDGVKPFDDCCLCPVKKFCKGTCLYKSPLYVESERVIKRQNVNKAINYVTKYLTKDLYLTRKLNNRIYQCFNIVNSDNPFWQLDDYKNSEFKKLKNAVLPFHLQSLGFGKYALEKLDNDGMIKSNSLSMPLSNKKVVMHIPLPVYFKRKLLYNSVYFNEETHYFPNNKYYDFAKKLQDKSIFNLALKIRAYLPNIDSETAQKVAKYHLTREGVHVGDWFLGDVDEKLLLPNIDYWTGFQRGAFWYRVKVRQNYRIDNETKSYVEVDKDFHLHKSFIDRKYWLIHHSRHFFSQQFFSFLDPVQKCNLFSPFEFSQILSDSTCFDSDLQKIVDDFLNILSNLGSHKITAAKNQSKQKFRYKKIGLLPS